MQLAKSNDCSENGDVGDRAGDEDQVRRCLSRAPQIDTNDGNVFEEHRHYCMTTAHAAKPRRAGVDELADSPAPGYEPRDGCGSTCPKSTGSLASEQVSIENHQIRATESEILDHRYVQVLARTPGRQLSRQGPYAHNRCSCSCRRSGDTATRRRRLACTGWPLIVRPGAPTALRRSRVMSSQRH